MIFIPIKIPNKNQGNLLRRSLLAHLHNWLYPYLQLGLNIVLLIVQYELNILLNCWFKIVIILLPMDHFSPNAFIQKKVLVYVIP